MNVLYFLQERTRFARAFYDEAVFPFTERKRKIETGEEPWEPPYSEDPEPAFLTEWMEADESIDVLGQMCISMLSSSLRLYLVESVNERLGRYNRESLRKAGIGRPEENKAAFKKGWINGYRVYFRDHLGIDCDTAAVNLSLLEEIVLARNRAQHPDSITTLKIEQSTRDAKKYPKSFFADEMEMQIFGTTNVHDEWLRPWRLNVTRDRLFEAIDEVERFCSWLDEQLRAWPAQLEQQDGSAAGAEP